MPEALMSTI